MEVVRYLLQLNIDPNYQQFPRIEGGPTAICHAAKGGHVQTIRCLIKYGADINPEMSDGTLMHPIHLAVKSGHMEAANILLEALGLEKLLKSSYVSAALLQLAAGCGSEKFVKQALEHGCHPDAKLAPTRRSRQTIALTWAAAGGHENIVKLLLSHGANINVQVGAFVEKPLLAAINNKHPQIVNMLLENGGDPSCIDLRGRPMFLFDGKHDAVIKVLLNHGIELAALGYNDDCMNTLLREESTLPRILLDRGVARPRLSP